MRKLIWRFNYIRQMQRRAGVSFSFAWESSNAWLDGLGMDMSGSDAADEEMSCWTNDGE